MQSGKRRKRNNPKRPGRNASEVASARKQSNSNLKPNLSPKPLQRKHPAKSEGAGPNQHRSPSRKRKQRRK